jgi:hypothetical protein
LEMELEAATEAGLELNKMLSEFLSTQRGSEDLVKSVELLQSQLNKQQTTISTMNQSLNAKTDEVCFNILVFVCALMITFLERDHQGRIELGTREGLRS